MTPRHAGSSREARHPAHRSSRVAPLLRKRRALNMARRHRSTVSENVVPSAPEPSIRSCSMRNGSATYGRRTGEKVEHDRMASCGDLPRFDSRQETSAGKGHGDGWYPSCTEADRTGQQAQMGDEHHPSHAFGSNHGADHRITTILISTTGASG